MGRTECGSRSGQKIFPHPNTLNWLWNPHSLSFKGYWGSLPGVKRPKSDADYHLHLAPRWNLSGAIDLLSLYGMTSLGNWQAFGKKKFTTSWKTPLIKIYNSIRYFVSSKFLLGLSSSILQRLTVTHAPCRLCKCRGYILLDMRRRPWKIDKDLKGGIFLLFRGQTEKNYENS